MCASCGGKLHMPWSKSLFVATPVPLTLAAGFLVPSGQDTLLLWTLGVAAMFVLYCRWVPFAKVLRNEAVIVAVPRHQRR